MKPLFAMAPVETASTEAALLQDLYQGVSRKGCDLSCRELGTMERLRQAGRKVCVRRFLLASQEAEAAFGLDGNLSPEFDSSRYEQCEFYRSEVDYWQEYHQGRQARLSS